MTTPADASAGPRMRVGVGGWSFAPWRGDFYPKTLPHAAELGFASRRLTSIEINATFYRTQSPASFARWADETPEDFVFSLKAHRLTTHRKSLALSGPAVEHFLASGLTELGGKLGPIVWQFAPTKKFEPEDFAAFLDLLPKEAGGRPLRHVLEVRHASFVSAEFVALARRRSCAICLAQSQSYPMIADLTADFIYTRLQTASVELAAGYSPEELDVWAERARLWRAGGDPPDLPHAAGAAAPHEPRDVFLYFIAGAKEKNPAAAQALIARLA